MKSSFLPIFAISLSIFCLAAHAQGPNKQFGEVNIQSTDTKAGGYAAQEAEALSWVRQVAANQKAASLSDSAVFYLTGLYLYCSGRAGACPFILDTILKAEQLAGRAGPSCPVMKRFWEAWVKNGFEERLPYLVPMGSTGTMKDFNDTKRARYIKCDQSILSNTPDQPNRSVALTLKLVEQVQQKKINVFEATGALKNEGPQELTTIK